MTQPEYKPKRSDDLSARVSLFEASGPVAGKTDSEPTPGEKTKKQSLPKTPVPKGFRSLEWDGPNCTSCILTDLHGLVRLITAPLRINDGDRSRTVTIKEGQEIIQKKIRELNKILGQ